VFVAGTPSLFVPDANVGGRMRVGVVLNNAVILARARPRRTRSFFTRAKFGLLRASVQWQRRSVKGRGGVINGVQNRVDPMGNPVNKRVRHLSRGVV
jgi:hypothetical protein